MRLEAHGHPLHTRALSVVLTARADGKLDVHGTVLDLRKRGFVPVAGDLQGAGIIHDMRLAGMIDPGRATLETLAAEQRSVAFEPSAVTAGESCRDPIDRIAALAWALARERALHGARPARPAGQRVFRRDVVIDGHESAAAGVQLTAQTSDLHFAPAGAVVRPMDRFAERSEEHTSELQSRTLISYAVFCLKKKK